jgi:hypothetical protein
VNLFFVKHAKVFKIGCVMMVYYIDNFLVGICAYFRFRVEVFFLLFLNFSELFELTLTDQQLAPPSGESCFSMNNYLFISTIL